MNKALGGGAIQFEQGTGGGGYLICTRHYGGGIEFEQGTGGGYLI